MQLFVPEGYYWAPACPGQTDPRSEVSLIFEANRDSSGHDLICDAVAQLIQQIPASEALPTLDKRWCFAKLRKRRKT